MHVLLSSVFFSKNVLDFWISDCCLQPPTHQVYVLLISNVTVGDAGLYTCEVNFNPVLRSFHQLKVIQNVFCGERILIRSYIKVLSPKLEPPAVPRSTAKPSMSSSSMSSSSSSSSSSSTKDSIDVWGYSTRF